MFSQFIARLILSWNNYCPKYLVEKTVGSRGGTWCTPCSNESAARTKERRQTRVQTAIRILCEEYEESEG